MNILYFEEFIVFPIRMAAQPVCAKHGEFVVTFCAKCVRQLCPACLPDEPLCKVGRPSEAHAFTKLVDVPGWMRNQLDSIQQQLRAEQNALLDSATRSACEMEIKEEKLHAEVDRTVLCTREALEMLRQLKRAISAATASGIARALRAGVDSNASKQRAEDVQTRALACRQLSSSVAALRNLDDSNLAQPINIAFVRNLVRSSFTEPVSAPAGTPTPARPALAPAPSHLSQPSTHLARAKQETPIESQLKNIVQQGKLFIQALESIFKVFTSLFPFATLLSRSDSSNISRTSLPTFIDITDALEILDQLRKFVFTSR